MNLLIRSDARFSPRDRYRYTLERIWEPNASLVNFLMLNPSTADLVKNDPTIERQQRRVMKWGYKHPLDRPRYGGLVVTNLFAWRSTDPDALLKAEDPIGPENDLHIVEQSCRADMVICGWGSHRAVPARAAHVLSLLRLHHIVPYALKVTTGQPWHPLYVGYSAEPKPFQWGAANRQGVSE